MKRFGLNSYFSAFFPLVLFCSTIALAEGGDGVADQLRRFDALLEQSQREHPSDLAPLGYMQFDLSEKKTRRNFTALALGSYYLFVGSSAVLNPLSGDGPGLLEGLPAVAGIVVGGCTSGTAALFAILSHIHVRLRGWRTEDYQSSLRYQLKAELQSLSDDAPQELLQKREQIFSENEQVRQAQKPGRKGCAGSMADLVLPKSLTEALAATAVAAAVVAPLTPAVRRHWDPRFQKRLKSNP